MATAADPTSMARRNVHRPITNIMGLLASGMASGPRLYRIGGGEGSSDETSRRSFRPGQAPNPVRGFHISELITPWRPLRAIVRQWLDATTVELKQTFKNTVLGEVWE